jgi:hypothetical protein
MTAPLAGEIADRNPLEASTQCGGEPPSPQDRRDGRGAANGVARPGGPLAGGGAESDISTTTGPEAMHHERLDDLCHADAVIAALPLVATRHGALNRWSSPKTAMSTWRHDCSCGSGPRCLTSALATLQWRSNRLPSCPSRPERRGSRRALPLWKRSNARRHDRPAPGDKRVARGVCGRPLSGLWADRRHK